MMKVFLYIQGFFRFRSWLEDWDISECAAADLIQCDSFLLSLEDDPFQASHEKIYLILMTILWDFAELQLLFLLLLLRRN